LIDKYHIRPFPRKQLLAVFDKPLNQRQVDNSGSNTSPDSNKSEEKVETPPSLAGKTANKATQKINEDVVTAPITKDEKDHFLFGFRINLAYKDHVATIVRIRKMNMGEKSTPERRDRAIKQLGDVIAIPGTKFGE